MVLRSECWMLDAIEKGEMAAWPSAVSEHHFEMLLRIVLSKGYLGWSTLRSTIDPF